MKTRNGLRFGISLPQNFPDGKLNHTYLRDYVREAESLGFEDGWLTENILSATFQLEPLTYLSHLAAVTGRIRLGVAVVLLNARNPVQLAKAAATVDQLSNGRLTLGIALGAAAYNFAAFGVPPERRVARFEEAVAVMKALWTQEEATVRGDFWTLERVRMQPKPVQKPHVPLVFGGHAEAALRRAVRLGDGWMAAGSVSMSQSLESLKKIRAFLAEAGRDESGFLLSKRLYIAIDDDETRARNELTRWLRYQYARDTSDMGLAASPSRAVEELGRLREAGVQHVALNPVYDHRGQMEILATKVIPQL